MKFSQYQKVVLGYNTILDILQKRGFVIDELETKLPNITEERVDNFFKAYTPIKKTQRGGYDSDHDLDDVIESNSQYGGADEHKGVSDDSSSDDSSSDDSSSEDSSSDDSSSEDSSSDDSEDQPSSNDYMKTLLKDTVCDVLSIQKISPDDQNQFRKKIYRNIANMCAETPTIDNFNTIITIEILQSLFKQYDKHFFKGTLDRLFQENSCTLQICWDNRCSKTAGKCSIQKKETCSEIKITLATKTFRDSLTKLYSDARYTGEDGVIHVGSVSCNDPLSCIQLIFEHELVHAIIDCFCPSQATAKVRISMGSWKGPHHAKSKHSKAFMSILNNTFGHDTYKHGLFEIMKASELSIRRKSQQDKLTTQATSSKALPEKKSRRKPKKRSSDQERPSDIQKSLNEYSIVHSSHKVKKAHVVFINKNSQIQKSLSQTMTDENQFSRGDHIILVIINSDTQDRILPQETDYEIERVLYNNFGKTRLSIFHIDQIVRNISLHTFVPKHTIISQSQANTIKNKHRGRLPRMLAFQQDNHNADPMCRFYGMVPGQIVKIERNSPTSCKIISYREVVSNIFDR